MGDALKGITGSKKFIFAILAMLVLALEKKLGLDLDDKTKLMFVAIAMTAIGAQGLNDIGKSKAIIEKETPNEVP